MSLDGGEADVLHAIKRTGTERIGAPWMAVEELAAQKALAYGEAHEAAALALNRLQGKSHREEPNLQAADPEGVRELWRAKYATLLEVLPTSETALREGMFREANVLPPAKRKGEGEKAPKIGGRDVAIWLTAIEYARENSDETVYFVSSNHRDFTKGGGGAYPPPMDADIQGLGDRFKHLTNLGDVLALVAPTVDIKEGDVRTLLARASWAIQEFAVGAWGSLDARQPFEVMTAAGTRAVAVGWLKFRSGPHVTLVDVGDFQAYKLGEEEYVVASARWQIVGLALVDGNFRQAATHWETRLLAPVTHGESDINSYILGHGAASAETLTVSDIEWASYSTAALDALQRVRELRDDRNAKYSTMELLMGFLIAMGNPKPTIRDIGRLSHVDREYLLAGIEDAAAELLIDGDAPSQEGGDG